LEIRKDKPRKIHEGFTRREKFVIGKWVGRNVVDKIEGSR